MLKYKIHSNKDKDKVLSNYNKMYNNLIKI